MDDSEHEPIPHVPWADRYGTMQRLLRELGRVGLTSAFRCAMHEDAPDVECTVTFKKIRKRRAR